MYDVGDTTTQDTRTRTRTWTRTWTGILVAVAVAVAAIIGVWAIGGASGAGVSDRPGAPPAAAAPTPSAAASSNPLAAGGLQDPTSSDAPQVPADATVTRVRIPEIGVDSSIESLSIGSAGELTAPVDYDLAGWYAGGVVPGRIGPAIIAGHVDSATGPAVFARIGELTPGSEVLVTLSTGDVLAFDITGSAQSAKSNFPTSDVYKNVPRPELRLITCAGSFDSSIGHYTDNLILFAALRQ